MSKIFYPFVWILTKSTNLLCKIFKVKADSKEKITDVNEIDDAIADALLDAMFDSVEEGNILFDDTISEDLLEENFDDGGVTENPDIDLLASNYTDPYIPIDNDMDMSEFA